MFLFKNDHQLHFFSGEYFVLGINLDRYDVGNPKKYLRGLLKKEEEATDRKVIEAFENYIGVVGSPSSKQSKNFHKMVNNYLQRPPFNFTGPPKQVRKLLLHYISLIVFKQYDF